MPSQHPPGSPRRAELLDACYGYVLTHGLAGLSLRPLAAATGTSPRVLLYLFESKENLVREEKAKDWMLEVDRGWRGDNGKRDLLPQPNSYARTNLYRLHSL